ncbi:tyrosine-type recombinase/integrase [Brevundimonas sp. PAMC22021]|nr:tyrosine-type recombinase/integrase [Brevundimonas sp. PAMC22021]
MSGGHMVTKRLTKRVVEALAPRDERYVVWDSDLKGFGVRISPQGRRTYLARFRTHGGSDRLMALAPHGVITAEEARERARLAIAEAAQGGDPQADKMERRGEMTMGELCELYMAEGTAMKKASTLKIDRIRIDRHIKPRVGRMKLSDVSRADIQRLMIDVGNGRIRAEATPHTRGGKHAAARTVGLLGGIFSFAIERKLMTENPVRGLKRYKDNRRDRFLSPAEMARLGDVLIELEKDGGDPRHINIIRLLLLTGARKNEIAHLKWSEVDLERGLLRLQDSKTGAKTIRLGAPAIRLMTGLRANGSVYVFPDRRHPKRPVANLDWAWVNIRKRAEMEDLRIHDLRHSFASAGLAGGEGLPLIGKLLGHSHISTTSRYAHLADDPLKAAADRISELVAMELMPTLVADTSSDPDI